jgi:UDP-N-acetylglucosamine 2-epimerase (non-hydrolysing)
MNDRVSGSGGQTPFHSEWFEKRWPVMKRIRVMHVVGTRPNFMKVAPILRAMDAWNEQPESPDRLRFDQCLVHTGQHYDDEMSSVFFRDLGLRAPDRYLDVRSGTHATQTSRLLTALEPVIVSERPDLVLVVGDVNSTLAAALVAVKLGVPVAHVEAGLRSGDRRMPEEINRVVVDHIARLLFTTSDAASRQLESEGVDPAWTHMVGNTMIDCLEAALPLAMGRAVHEELGLADRSFALVTLHRPSNVDDSDQLGSLVGTIVGIAQRLPVVFPIHGRTAARLRGTRGIQRLETAEQVHLLTPLGYIEFMSLMAAARLVVTDSGGIQAESCVAGTPCITVRTTTEWPETVEAGLNHLVDPADGSAVLSAVEDVLRAPVPLAGARPDRWDGRAAERVVAVVVQWSQQSGGMSTCGTPSDP